MYCIVTIEGDMYPIKKEKVRTMGTMKPNTLPQIPEENGIDE